MQTPIISGIQQIGVGIPDVYAAFKFYRQTYGLDIPIFDEAAEANLMLPYTGGEPRSRHAILAINMQGGGGLEIWQYTSRVPQPPADPILFGDLGILHARIKSTNVPAAYQWLNNKKVKLHGKVLTRPDGAQHCYSSDPYGNIFDIVPSDNWFSSGKFLTGGIYGATIGVRDVDTSIRFYREILGYDEVVYDVSGTFDDFAPLPGGQHRFRRALLRHKAARIGSFSRMLGAGEIELVSVLDRTPKSIFENRFWGDLGFIHLCFDINGMAAMRDKCAAAGHPFTVDSSADRETFDMGEAAGNFSYIEDPDGTLIEFVETHKVPILKKFNWYLDLRKRDPQQSLPNWMLKAMALGRVKD